MKLTLSVRPNPRIQVERTYSSGEITIGRDPGCDVVMAVPLVSSEHARLFFDGEEWTVSDLFSTNGTFVNGERVTASRTIQQGDRIQFGQDGPLIEFKHFDKNAPVVQTAEIVAEPAPRPSPQVKTTPAVETPLIARPARPSAPAPPVAPPPRTYVKPAATKARKKKLDERRAIPSVIFHTVSVMVTAFVVITLGGAFAIYTAREPSRGYTSFGLLVGFVGSGLFVLVGVYIARKRWFQELLPGRLLTWLRVHLWFSLIAMWLIFLHAGFHLDGGSGSYTMIALLATLVSGFGGWALYQRVPNTVYETVGNLARVDVRNQIQQLDWEIEDHVAGRSPVLADYAVRLKRGQRAKAFAGPQEEVAVAEEIAKLSERKRQLRRQLKRQTRLHFWLRSWLVLHIPCALLFLAVLPYHMYDALEVKYVLRKAGPADFADPQSCAKCHQNQYDEWIASMHAIAQGSPVTFLQNRLVLLKEERDLAEGRLLEPLVGDLCVKCHAPTSRLGNEADLEDPFSNIEDRAPASMFGVSCVSCHQISAIHPGAPDEEDVRFKNAANLEFTHGKTMFGPHGDVDPSVGNSEHRGVFGEHFTESSFCASCHTVSVKPPGGELVQLQNTFKEWEDGGAGVNWSELNVDCLDCHGKNLSSLVETARQLESSRIDLDERLERFVEALKENRDLELPEDLQYAAMPPDGFDRALPPRRDHLHTFVGVDYHLEPDLPYPKGHPRNSENAEIQQRALRHTENLLKIAAAVRIDDSFRSTGSSLSVDVMNLGTGHHLPAGFSFAREMWIEVGVSESRTGDDFKIVAGGKNDRPLLPTERHRKLIDGQLGRLKNFQSVLWNGQRGQETVLQNEVVRVLTGPDAVTEGFPDREKFLLPGQTRRVSIRLPTGAVNSSTRRVRVRLLFRNYPPEFLEGLAERFENDHGESENAERARKLIDNLHIFEMATDVKRL